MVAWLSLDLHSTSGVPAGTGEVPFNFFIFYIFLNLFPTGVDEYDSKLTKQWSTVVRDIHDRIKHNFGLIQHTINVLIGLVTIVLRLTVGPVMGILKGLVKMVRKVKTLRENLTVLKARSVVGFSQRKSNPYFSRNEGVSDL